jgi:orotidine-5'-phosphate decarboxylase
VPDVFAVTILTSIGAADLGELGLAGGPGENAIRLAALARDARCPGVVCSVRDVEDLKSYFGTTFGTLCPGIRPVGSAHGDQKRAATPTEAREAGADYAVVGRPITGDADPVAAARAILADLQG